MLGPTSPAPTRLKSCAGASTRDRLAVADREQRKLGTGQAFFDHEAPSGVAERGPREIVTHRIARFGDRLGDDDAFAGGQPVGLDDVKAGHRVEVRERGFELGERRVARGGHARGIEHFFHPRLRALEPGPVGAGTEAPLALRPQAVGHPGDERILGTDHEQVGVDLIGRAGRSSSGCRRCRG